MSDRLTPEREAEIAERFSSTGAVRGSDVSALLAELTALRAENVELGQEAAKLAALEAYGVDGWEGYDDALAGVRQALAEGAGR